MLTLTADQIHAAWYAVADLCIQREVSGRNIPAEVIALQRILEAAARHTSSAYGTVTGGIGCETGSLTHGDPIDTATAAHILGCSTRRVRTIAAKLSGTRVGRQWIFQRAAVENYAAKTRGP